MKLDLKKDRFINIALIIVCVISLVFAGYQYKQKEMYESHISKVLNDDIRNMVNLIEDNERLYQDILNSDDQLDEKTRILSRSNETISTLMQKNADLAVEFNQVKKGFEYNQTSSTALRIAMYFHEWDEDTVSSKSKEQIEKLQQLNSGWQDSISEYKNDKYPFTGSSWIKLIVSMEGNTNQFLLDNKMKEISQLWRSGSE